MLLEEYRAGNRVSVWDRLHSLGEKVRNSEVFDDALAVARETMHRARRNIELLARRLPETGYKFEHPEAAHVPPSAEGAKLIAEIEETVGPLPLSFRAFYEIVGSVDFCQAPDQLVHWSNERRQAATEIELLGEEDPLFVLPLSVLHADLMAARSSKRRVGRYARFGWRKGGENHWYCQFAPDEYHKAKYSGGENYNLFIPDAAADSRIRDLFLGTSDDEEQDREWFIDHLRNAFLGGGFRGKQDPDDFKKSPPSSPLIQGLRTGLLEV